MVLFFGGAAKARQSLILPFFLLCCLSCQHFSLSRIESAAGGGAAGKAENEREAAKLPVFQAKGVISDASPKAAESGKIKRSDKSPASESPVLDRNYLQIQADVLYLNGEEALYEGEPSKALDYFREAAFFAPRSLHLQIRRAEIYAEEGILSEAAKTYEKVLISDPENQIARQRLAQIYAEQGLSGAASGQYKELLSRNPGNFQFRFQQALALGGAGDWRGALDSLKKAERLVFSSEEKGQILMARAWVYGVLGNRSGRNKALKQLSSMQFRDEDMVLRVAGFYADSGDIPAAASILLDYQERDESSVTAAKALLSLYLAGGDGEGAYTQLMLIRQAGALEPPHYFYMLSFFLERGEYDQAILFLRDLVSGNPSETYYRYLLGAAYEKSNRLDLALQEYGRIEEGSAYFAMARKQIAGIWKRWGETERPLSVLEKAAYDSPETLLFYAQMVREKDRERSILVLTKGLERFPAHSDILFLRGMYLGESGQHDLSLADMTRILEKDADHQEALNFMAYTYAERNVNLDQAERWARKALSLQPDSSHFLDTLGWVLFRKGGLEEARPYLERAFSLNSEDSHIAKHLGELHYQLQNFKKCEYFFREALKREANDQRRRQIEQSLKRLQAHL